MTPTTVTPTPSEAPARVHETVAALLRAAGHRYTTARRVIVTALERSDAPLTIPQLLAADIRLAQSSTYRNVMVLEEVGAVTRIVTTDVHARFELDERVTRHHHHHIICTDCGDVHDFELPIQLERDLQVEFGRASRTATFRMERHRIDVLGRCTTCS